MKRWHEVSENRRAQIEGVIRGAIEETQERIHEDMRFAKKWKEKHPELSARYESYAASAGEFIEAANVAIDVLKAVAYKGAANETAKDNVRR